MVVDDSLNIFVRSHASFRRLSNRNQVTSLLMLSCAFLLRPSVLWIIIHDGTPSLQVHAIGQWQYGNVQMGRPAKHPLRRRSKGQIKSCISLSQCDLRHQNYGPQLSKPGILSALPGPSLCPIGRHIDIRAGSGTHGSPSYPTVRHASPERLYFFLVFLLLMRPSFSPRGAM